MTGERVIQGKDWNALRGGLMRQGEDINEHERYPSSDGTTTGRGNVGGREPTCLSAFQVPPFRPVKDVVAHKKKGSWRPSFVLARWPMPRARQSWEIGRRVFRRILGVRGIVLPSASGLALTQIPQNFIQSQYAMC